MGERFSKIRARVLIFLSVIGPGIIAANADNDAGGITTYSVVGAEYGTTLLWVLFLVTFSLAVTQEMGMRIGLVTRQGLGGVIREKFGVRWTGLAMLTLLIANIGTIAAEFAGIAASLSIFGVSRYISVPLAAVVIWLILMRGSFKTTQKIFLIFSAFYLVYIINGFVIGPDFGGALHSLITPTWEWSAPFFLTTIALIGTTITPWGQFFIQSYVVDKRIDVRHYKIEKAEVFFGAFVTNVVSFFIIVCAAATLHTQGIKVENASDVALALKPLAGNLAQLLFAFGLFSASMLGAFILPTSTAYALCEAFGWEYGFDNDWRHGRVFYILILLALAIPAIVVLLPRAPLIKIMLLSQSVNGLLLPVILIFVMKIINDRKIMGEHTNKILSNIIAWLTVAGIVIATLILLGAILSGQVINF